MADNSDDTDIPADLLITFGIRASKVKSLKKITHEFPHQQIIESNIEKPEKDSSDESEDENQSSKTPKGKSPKTPKSPKDEETSSKKRKRDGTKENEDENNKENEKDDKKPPKKKKKVAYPNDDVEDPEDPPEIKKKISTIKVEMKECLKSLEVVDSNKYTRKAKSVMTSLKSKKDKDDKDDDEEFPVCNCPPSSCCATNSCLNKISRFECNSKFCPCGLNCQNTRFQNKCWKKLFVGRAGQKGFGLFAGEDIQKGEFVIEYVGEVITDEIYKERQTAYEEKRHFYFLKLSNGLFIDALKIANIARFVNHSCDPCLETQKWNVGKYERVGFFATKDVKKGTELSFDYCFETYGAFEMKCLCGSKNCRGTIRPQATQVVLTQKEKNKREFNEQKARAVGLIKSVQDFSISDLIPRASTLLVSQTSSPSAENNGVVCESLSVTEKKEVVEEQIKKLIRKRKIFLIRNVASGAARRMNQIFEIRQKYREKHGQDKEIQKNFLIISDRELERQKRKYALLQQQNSKQQS